ncbi:hypothetical protein KR018_006860 [Drosophila ironensis]|nr:hypothetical protein KR018_006860 [Drosophila ironensis]
MDQATSSSSVLQLAQADELDNDELREELVAETEASKVAEHQEFAEALSLSGRRYKSPWNRRRCRPQQVLSVTAILIALLLIVGAIYMHLRQKHHLGRLHVPSNKNHHAASLEAEVEEDAQLVIAEGGVEATTFRTSRTQLSSECLACVAATVTGNVPAVCWGGVQCGIYRISRPYWQDALERIETNEESLTLDYDACVTLDSCAGRIVEGYVRRYGSDCNGDGRIECRDHIMLHVLGPGACRRHQNLDALAERRVHECMKNKGIA